MSPTADPAATLMPGLPEPNAAATVPRELPPAEAPRDNIAVGSVSAYVPGQAPTPEPRDPFEDVIASVRTASVGCFSGMAPGDYDAMIEVNVTPTGTASRVEVTYGPDVDAVRKCLVLAATRTYPSSAGGRKLSIDVHVRG